jgi:ketosteroid isomerase-like protein
MPEYNFSVDGILESYAKAVAAKDAASLMQLYDPNVRVFDAWECWSYEGASAWGAAVRGWFDSLGSETVRVTFDGTQSSAVQELVIVSSIVTYMGVSSEGKSINLDFLQKLHV